MTREYWAVVIIWFTVGLFDNLPPPAYAALYLYVRSQFNQSFLQ